MPTDYASIALEKHYEWRGKLSVEPKVPVDTAEALSIAYTPGVAAPCLEIQRDPDKSYELTGRNNTVAVITDGSAVLGLGNIGPEAGMPVMEGKCMLFKAFGGVDAIPLCVRTNDVDEFVHAVSLLLGSFGGVNLEDISAPRCFDIEEKLKAVSDIPIFHDDQHGTAVVTLAGLTNALAIVGKRMEDVRVVMSGAGAAGTAIIKLLLARGLKNVIMTDKDGVIYDGRSGMDPHLAEMAISRTRSAGAARWPTSSRAPTCSSACPPQVCSPRTWSAPWSPAPSSSPARTPRPRSCPTRPSQRAPPWSRPDAATSRTRSITCSRSPASSAARSTSAPATSTTP